MSRRDLKRKRFLNNSVADDDNKVEAKRAKPLLSGVKKGSVEHRFERRRYLSQLLHEFQNTNSMECRQQILANLTNFAYDSYNYPFFQELKIIAVFLAELSVCRDERLVEFAMAGICNCAADKGLQRDILTTPNALQILKKHHNISRGSVDIILSLITTLIILANGNEDVKQDIKADSHFYSSLSNLMVHEDKRIRNVAEVLLDELN